MPNSTATTDASAAAASDVTTTPCNAMSTTPCNASATDTATIDASATTDTSATASDATATPTADGAANNAANNAEIAGAIFREDFKTLSYEDRMEYFMNMRKDFKTILFELITALEKYQSHEYLANKFDWFIQDHFGKDLFDHWPACYRLSTVKQSKCSCAFSMC
ncbi:uncharacterized protein LOC120354507 [Nilaparvata lugens]|uniref:uncharacterized protein LOC120354507 n=1 Tax=Nilaparvata lugens TaxID=108931 RepID=UPI00193E5709|nr:uncharacterized protein LOC120354507 [Nilaparvata lugens]